MNQAIVRQTTSQVVQAITRMAKKHSVNDHELAKAVAAEAVRRLGSNQPIVQRQAPAAVGSTVERTE